MASRPRRLDVIALIVVADEPTALAVRKQAIGSDHATFTRLAAEHSQDPSTREQGGVMAIRRGVLQADVEREAYSLRRGETSRPFPLGEIDCWCIVQRRRSVIRWGRWFFPRSPWSVEPGIYY